MARLKMHRPKFTEVVEHDARAFFWFGKIYEFFVNERGNYESRPIEITDKDREVFGADVDKMIEEMQK